MIEVPTVLILGAGASQPYGYPLGIDLKNKIISRFDRLQHHGTSYLDKLDLDVDLVREFIYNFRRSTRTSIDSFLNYHKDEYAEIGKIGIVEIISSCESPKKPITKEEILGKPIVDDWHQYLAEFIFNCDFDDINDNKLSIINYNYDRILEAFLYTSLRFNYKEGVSNAECASKIKKIPFIHMYGRLDPLPWEVKGGRAYGSPCSTDDILKISKNLRLIHEAAKEGIPKKADNLIAEAERVYFLGLDLRRQETLNQLDLTNLKHKEIVATAFGLEQSEITQIQRVMESNANISSPDPEDHPIVGNMETLAMIRTHKAFQ